MKKICAIMLAALLMLISITGCGGNTGSSSTTSGVTSGKTSGEATASSNKPTDDGKPVWNAALGKYEPDLEIEVVTSISNDHIDQMSKVGWTKEDNAYLDYYEKTYGIKVKYRWISDNDMYREKLQLAIGANDMPDMFYAPSTDIVFQLYDAGVIQSLTNAYESTANESLKKAYDSAGGAALEAVTMSDGKLAALPRLEPPYDNNSYLWIRNDWLEKVNMEAPKTMDDLYNVAKAFKQADPDKSGNAFGMIADKGLWYSLRGFFWGFGAYPEIWVDSGNGTYVYGATQPVMKDALTMLNKMYSEGLLDREFGAKSSSDVIEDITSGRSGIVYAGHWLSFQIQTMLQTHPDADWRCYDLPSATGSPVRAEFLYKASQLYCVNSKFEHPEALIHILNTTCFIMTEGIYDMEDSKIWTPYVNDIEKGASNLYNASPFYQGDPNVNMLGHRKIIEMKNALDKDGVAISTDNYHPTFVEWYNFCFDKDPVVAFGYNGYFGPTEYSALSVLDRQIEAGTVVFNKYNGTLSIDATDKFNTLKELCDKTVTDIIIGNVGLAEGFDGLLKNWKTFGGDDVSKEVNDWFASK